jgi:hypothetical protein
VVTGSGAFELKASQPTTLTWKEGLIFPWWIRGSLGAMCARPVFRWIWARNLERLSERIVSP